MDADLSALAWKGASTVVALLATDAWEKAKTALGSLWRRAHPERADALEAELMESRASVLNAREGGDEALENALTLVWQSRLAHLLSTDPALAAQFQHLLNEVLVPALPINEQTRIVKLEMHARASGHGRVYQAGRVLSFRNHDSGHA